MKKTTKFIFPALILISGILVSYSVLAQTNTPVAGDSGTKNINFPIPELGNCANKESCRLYCEKPENMEVCVTFAKTNGLMEKEEASRAEKYVQGIKNGNGPGGCTDAKNCDAFCSNVSNLDVCLAWSDKNGIKDKNFEEAKKIQGFIKSGGQLPGGCTSKEGCDAYCNDFSHAEECFAFADKAGLDIGATEEPNSSPRGPSRQGGSSRVGPPPRQILALIKSGQTPGGCKSRNECESYCEGGDHFEECIAFAEKAGMMDPKEAEMIKKTGGKGPGGCQGRQACDTFCNNPANRDACFKFAEENGLISPEDLKMAKEGMTRMRAGLESAPPEVKDCLKSELGPNIIEEIQSGKLVPGPEIGDKARSCFEKAGGSHDPREVLKNAPPEVLTCLKEKSIDVEKLKSGKTEFTPEMGDAFRICFESMKFMGPNGPMMGGEGGPNGRQDGPTGGPPPNFSEFLRSAPSEVSQCFQNSLGGDFEKLKSGEAQPTPELGEKIKTCFEQFRPQDPRMMGPSGPGGPGGLMMNGIPKETEDCVKSALGEDNFSKFQKGELHDQTAMEKVRSCMGSFGTQNMGAPFPPGQMGPGENRRGMMPSGGQFGSGNQGAGPSFPVAVSECLKKQLSESQISDLMRGSKPSGDIEQVIGKCFSENGGADNFVPLQRQGGGPTRQGTSPSGQMWPNNQIPPNGMMPPANFQGSGPSNGQLPNNQPPGDFRPPEGGQFPGGTPPSGFSGSQPPSGMMPPAGQMPPAGFIPPQGFTPPPGEFQDGTPPPPPQSYQSKPSLLGVIFGPLLNLITR